MRVLGIWEWRNPGDVVSHLGMRFEFDDETTTPDEALRARLAEMKWLESHDDWVFVGVNRAPFGT